MKKKGVFLDPGFWLLIGINVYVVYYYYQHPEIFTTLIWLYWSQSVMLGIFTFFDILTTKTTEDIPTDQAAAFSGIHSPEPRKPLKRSSSAFAFLLFYGFFHLVYLVFIGTMKKSGAFQWDFYKYFLLAFFIGQLFSFIQRKVRQHITSESYGAMFGIPFIRILPMHLTIVLPGFLNISNIGIFLVLKGIADVVMYVVTKPSKNGKEQDAAYIASQQSLNI